MRGYALNVRTRIKIISVAWARTVIQLGRVASSTHLNSPSLHFSAYGLVNNHKNHKNNEISIPHLHRNN
jgi:hypothetical protein